MAAKRKKDDPLRRDQAGPGKRGTKSGKSDAPQKPAKPERGAAAPRKPAPGESGKPVVRGKPTRKPVEPKPDKPAPKKPGRRPRKPPVRDKPDPKPVAPKEPVPVEPEKPAPEKPGLTKPGKRPIPDKIEKPDEAKPGKKPTPDEVVRPREPQKPAPGEFKKPSPDELRGPGELVEIPDLPLLGVDHTEAFADLRETHPLLMLPVRLETRFEGQTLKVRIYPDQVHLDEHQESLTATEDKIGRSFWRRREAAETDEERAAVEEWLVTNLSARRAAWVARQTRPTVKGDGSLKFPQRSARKTTEPAKASALPDRWAVVGWVNGTQEFARFGAPVPPDLAFTPRLDDAAAYSEEEGVLPVDAGFAWMVDYDEAIKVGMGITVSLDDKLYGDVQSHGLTLLAVGIRDETPAAGAETLAGVLEAHHYTDGLEFVPQGTPTNNTDEGIAGWTEDVDDVTGMFARELDAEGLAVGADTDAARLALALGLDSTDLLDRVLHGGATEEVSASAMNRALWPVTWGRYLDELLAPMDGKSIVPPAVQRDLEEWFVGHVRGNAALPVVSIGSQPYGVLPVRRTKSLDQLSDWEDTLEWVLLDLRERWRESVGLVPRLDPVLGDAIGEDPEDDTIAILGSVPHPGRLIVRRVTYQREIRLFLWEWTWQEIRKPSHPLNFLADWYDASKDTLQNVDDQLELLHQVRRQVPGLPAAHRDDGYVVIDSFILMVEAHRARQSPVYGYFPMAVDGVFDVDRFNDPRLFWAGYGNATEDRLFTRALVEPEEPPDGSTAADYLESLRQRVPFHVGEVIEVDDALEWRQPDSGKYSGTHFLTKRSSSNRSLKSARRQTSVGGLLGEGAAGLIGKGETGRPSRVEGIVDSGRVEEILDTRHPGSIAVGEDGLSADFHADEPLLFQLLDSVVDGIPAVDGIKYRLALAALRDTPVDRLELRLRETLGLASHRIDAWLAGFANKRLAGMRGGDDTSTGNIHLDKLVNKDPGGTVKPDDGPPRGIDLDGRGDMLPDGFVEAGDARPTGIQLGGFGWVEDLKPDAASSSETQGFVHAPSLAHAATAAVLRAGWNAHGTDAADSTLAVDLRSDRVRLAAWILDGIRQGQALGDLLGCRFERRLHDNGLNRFIDDCRRAVLESQEISRDPRGPVDGLELAELYEASGIAVEDGAATIEPDVEPSGTERKALKAALDDVLAGMDAVADASIADSLHHILQGNTARASATLDAVSTGAVPPPGLRSMHTPRPGVGVTHRLMLALDPAAENAESPEGWGTGPRAALEPALEAWAASLLPRPQDAVCTVSFDGEAGAEGTAGGESSPPPEPEPVTVTMADLVTSHGISALDAVFTAPAASAGADSAWGRRIAAHLLAEPEYASFEGGLTIDFAAAAAPLTANQVTFEELALLARRLRSLLARARGLDGRDLVLPGEEAEPGWDLDDAETRVQQVLDQFGGAAEALADRLPAASEEDPHPVGERPLGELRSAMLGLSGYALGGAVPSAGWIDGEEGRATLYEEAWTLSERAGARLTALAELDAAWAEEDAGADPADAVRLRRARGRLAQVFGRAFPLLVHFTAPAGATVSAALDRSDELLEGDPGTATGWLQKVAKVRAPAEQLDDVISLSELIVDESRVAPIVGQLPDVAGEGWVAVQAPADASQGHLAFFVVDGGGVAPLGKGEPLAGLVFDAWLDQIPGRELVTGAALHFDAPTSRAPQSMLLVVPPEGEAWSFDLVVDSLMETLEAAKLRAVDPDILLAHGHQFPAIFPPGSISAGPQPETD